MQLIYRLTSPSGKVYIGQTKNLSSRMSSYRHMRSPQQRALYASLQKYGFEAHKLYIVHRFPEPVSQKIIDDYERYVIRMHELMKGVVLLNLTKGGRGNGHMGPRLRRTVWAGARGEKHRLAKLTVDDVRAMRSVYVKGSRGLGIRQLSEHFGISQRLVYNIVNRRTWKHVDGESSNSEDLAKLLRERLKAETEHRTRERYGPKRVYGQCVSLKASGQPCPNRATHGITCGSHANGFRELQRTLALEKGREGLKKWATRRT